MLNFFKRLKEDEPLLVYVIIPIGLFILSLFIYVAFIRNDVQRSRDSVSTDFDNIAFDVISEWNDRFQLHVMYPITPNEIINTRARNEIDTYVNDFRNSLETLPQNPPRPYELNINGTANFANGSWVNFIFEGLRFLGGDTESIKVNRFYSLERGNEAELSNFMRSDSYLTTLSTESRRKLPEILGNNFNQSIVNNGTNPVKENFGEFEIVDAKKLNIILQSGQVAPISVGVVKVPITFFELRNDLNDKALIEFPEIGDSIKENTPPENDSPITPQPPTGEVQNVPNLVNCAVEKCIALTFDDGPGVPTGALLDTFRANNAVGTFYLLGLQVPGRASLVQRMLAEGHELGNHSWSHVNFKYSSNEVVRYQVDRTDQAILNAVGVLPPTFRPPYGSFRNENISTVNMPFVIWNIDPEDWRNRDADIVYNRVMQNARPGGIVVAHDIHPTTEVAFRRIIPDLIAQGYRLVTVSDLLDIFPPSANVRVFFSR